LIITQVPFSDPPTLALGVPIASLSVDARDLPLASSSFFRVMNLLCLLYDKQKNQASVGRG
jgi:hypothetical protein